MIDRNVPIVPEDRLKLQYMLRSTVEPPDYDN